MSNATTKEHRSEVEQGRAQLEETLRKQLVGRTIVDVLVLAPSSHPKYIAKVLLKLDDDTNMEIPHDSVPAFSALYIDGPHPALIEEG